MCAELVTLRLQVLNEALARARVGVATIHETMYERAVGNAVFCTDFHQFEEVVQRRVHATCGGQAHQMHFLSRFLRVAVSSNNLRVLEDAVVAAGDVDFHEVLIDHASCADVEVPDLGVAHLSVGQAYALTASQQLRMRETFQ